LFQNQAFLLEKHPLTATQELRHDLFSVSSVRRRPVVRRLDRLVAITRYEEASSAAYRDIHLADLGDMASRDASVASPVKNKQTRPAGTSSRRAPPGGWAERSEERGFGRNVSSQEIDDLDREAAEYALSLRASKKNRRTAIDLGCGDGIGGVRFALSGIDSILYDLAFPRTLLRLMQEYRLGNIKKIARDMAQITENHLPHNVDVVYSQRALHYLTSDELFHLLSQVRKRCNEQCRVFLSIAGYDTEIGRSHSKRNLSLESRHGLPSKDMQSKHLIRHPLTIYRKQEFVDLVEAASFKVLKCEVSQFGNIKGSFKTD
jgi:SpoVK/Ycf46/Vps4 family AAA+-type ATPase